MAVKKKAKKRDEALAHFKAGMSAMLDWLEPEVVLVYGSAPESAFGDVWDRSEFVRYPDWTTHVRQDVEGAQPEEEFLKPKGDANAGPGDAAEGEAPDGQR